MMNSYAKEGACEIYRSDLKTSKTSENHTNLDQIFEFKAENLQDCSKLKFEHNSFKEFRLKTTEIEALILNQCSNKENPENFKISNRSPNSTNSNTLREYKQIQ